MNVLAVSVTEAGRQMAERLPYERAHAGLRNVGFEGSTHRERLSSDWEIG